MPYNAKAFEIVKKSINSAIFIDEKAREFYSETALLGNLEEKLSVDLHKNFKEQGVSLAVHKFQKSDMDNDEIKRFLFKDRDLVLLDWELDEHSGEEYSLKLLSEVIDYPHINFCCIYTSTPRFNDIFQHVKSFFSGLSKGDYDKIKEAYDFIEYQKIKNELAKIKNSTNIIELLDEMGISWDMHPLLLEDKNRTDEELLDSLIFSFEQFHKSTKRQRQLTSVSQESDSFVINNTFVFILSKDGNNDPKPSVLIKRISDQLVKDQNSFIQLLGLEMQTIFNDNESFLDENLLKSSTQALFSHRNYLKDINKSDIPFNTLIKSVLIEHATLRLRTAKLSILEEEFLNTESNKYKAQPEKSEVASMNTFYNAVNVKALNETDIPSVNFGDVFLGSNDKFYLCITALCDCLRPNKIDHNYYFVEGSSISIDVANSLGDSAFISYLPNNIAVTWGGVDLVRPKKVKKGQLTESEFEIEKLKATIFALEEFKYRPVYIKPKQFNLLGSKIKAGFIDARKIVYNEDKGVIVEDLPSLKLKYIVTLRPNYAQRITNHAFTHPIRVGVDFMKI